MVTKEGQVQPPDPQGFGSTSRDQSADHKSYVTYRDTQITTTLRFFLISIDSDTEARAVQAF